MALWQGTLPSITWTDIVLGLIVTYQQNPLRAARVLSGLNVAIHDALVQCSSEVQSEQLCFAAAHAAGSEMLDYFYAFEPPGKYVALGNQAWMTLLHMHPTREHDLHKAWDIGHRVSHEIKWRMLNDGSDLPWDVMRRPAPSPGTWVPTPPLMGYNPVEPTAPGWRLWTMASPEAISVPPPPQVGSRQYNAEVREVLDTFRALTPDQSRIAEEWNLGSGSVTPPGVWNRHARKFVLEAGLDATKSAQVFATLNAAALDALIVGWHIKLTYWTERPVTAIRREIAPDFLPLLTTPTFPGYLSCHAIVSGAAQIVLSHYFPAHADRFLALAEEAAQSRLYGGIHLRSDNEQGLNAGRKIGMRAIDISMRNP